MEHARGPHVAACTIVRATLSAILALSTTLLACATDESEVDETCEDGKCDGPATQPAFDCSRLPISTAPLGAPVAGLKELPGIPLPTVGPNAQKYFHPEKGYMEGGRYEAAEDRAEWRVAPSDITPPAPAGSIRVAEWNAERGKELDKLVKVMKKINADVWILNETDLYRNGSGTPISQNKVIARELARALGYSYVTGVEFYERRADRKGMSGNAILSRSPLRDADSMYIPMLEEQGGLNWARHPTEPRCGQRQATSAIIDVKGASGTMVPLKLISLHTENESNPTVRKAQYESVRTGLGTEGEPTIMAGDLNTTLFGEGTTFRAYIQREWERFGRDKRMFDCSRGDNATTWSKFFIKLRLDWMFVQSGTGMVIDCPQYRVHPNDGASDHKPVVSTVTIK